MAPTELSRDPLSEFVSRGLGVLETHSTEIALLKQELAHVTAADVECRKRQADAWEKLAVELEGIRANIGRIASGQAEHAKQHDVEAAGVTRQDKTLDVVLKFLSPLLVLALGAWLKWGQ